MGTADPANIIAAVSCQTLDDLLWLGDSVVLTYNIVPIYYVPIGIIGI